jgi:hypothetical protein
MIISIYPLTYVRIYGLTGLMPGGENHGNTFYKLLMWPTAPDPMTTEYALYAWYSFRGADGAYVTNGAIFAS